MHGVCGSIWSLALLGECQATVAFLGEQAPYFGDRGLASNHFYRTHWQAGAMCIANLALGDPGPEFRDTCPGVIDGKRAERSV